MGVLVELILMVSVNCWRWYRMILVLKMVYERRAEGLGCRLWGTYSGG